MGILGRGNFDVSICCFRLCYQAFTVERCKLVISFTKLTQVHFPSVSNHFWYRFCSCWITKSTDICRDSCFWRSRCHELWQYPIILFNKICAVLLITFFLILEIFLVGMVSFFCYILLKKTCMELGQILVYFIKAAYNKWIFSLDLFYYLLLEHFIAWYYFHPFCISVLC